MHKLTALTKVTKYLDIESRILIKASFDFLFKYFPLTWMFWSKTTTNRISQLHKRAIRLVDNSHVFPFDEFLENGSFTVHHYSQRSDSFNRDVQGLQQSICN